MKKQQIKEISKLTLWSENEIKELFEFYWNTTAYEKKDFKTYSINEFVNFINNNKEIKLEDILSIHFINSIFNKFSKKTHETFFSENLKKGFSYQHMKFLNQTRNYLIEKIEKCNTAEELLKLIYVKYVSIKCEISIYRVYNFKSNRIKTLTEQEKVKILSLKSGIIEIIEKTFDYKELINK